MKRLTKKMQEWACFQSRSGLPKSESSRHVNREPQQTQQTALLPGAAIILPAIAIVIVPALTTLIDQPLLVA